jgi:hypothetical protein
MRWIFHDEQSQRAGPIDDTVAAAMLRVGNRALNASISFACLFTLVLTGSRFGLVTAACGLALIFCFAFGVASAAPRSIISPPSILAAIRVDDSGRRQNQPARALAFRIVEASSRG